LLVVEFWKQRVLDCGCIDDGGGGGGGGTCTCCSLFCLSLSDTSCECEREEEEGFRFDGEDEEEVEEEIRKSATGETVRLGVRRKNGEDAGDVVVFVGSGAEF